MSALARYEPLDQFCLSGLALVLPVVVFLYAYGCLEQQREPKPVTLSVCGLDDWGCELGHAYARGWRPRVAAPQRRASR